jgi:hypothetical protein
MSDKYRRYLDKYTGKGGVKCCCCNSYKNKEKKKLNRIVRRVMKQIFKNKYLVGKK